VRVVLNAVALWVAVVIVSGVEVDATTTAGKIGTYLVVGLIFGVINATIRPIVKLLTLPLAIITLGFFALVVNALLFWLAAALSDALDIPFRVDGFWAAFWGAIVVGLVSWALNAAVRRD